jgi:glutamate-1-semialdehyde aminotransferase
MSPETNTSAEEAYWAAASEAFKATEKFGKKLRKDALSISPRKFDTEIHSLQKFREQSEAFSDHLAEEISTLSEQLSVEELSAKVQLFFTVQKLSDNVDMVAASTANTRDRIQLIKAMY